MFPIIFELILHAILIIFFGYIIYKRERTNLFSFIYLCTIPIFIFYQGETLELFFGLVFGYTLFISLRNSSLKKTILLFILLGIIYIIFHTKIDVYKIEENIQIINQQRGEHVNPIMSFIPRLFHNKIQLIYSILDRSQNLFSIKSLFIQHKYNLYSPAFYLGCLFPWDIFTLVYLFNKNISHKNFKIINFYWLTIPFIYLLMGLTSYSTGFINTITISLVYWLAIYNSFIFTILNRGNQFLLTLMNIVFIILILSISIPFIQPVI